MDDILLTVLVRFLIVNVFVGDTEIKFKADSRQLPLVSFVIIYDSHEFPLRTKDE